METLRELQFWIPKLKLDKTAAKETTAWAACWRPSSLALLGDRNDLGQTIIDGVQGPVPVQDVQGDYRVQLQMNPGVFLSGMGSEHEVVNIYLNLNEAVWVGVFTVLNHPVDELSQPLRIWGGATNLANGPESGFGLKLCLLVFKIHPYWDSTHLTVSRVIFFTVVVKLPGSRAEELELGGRSGRKSLLG